MKLCTIVPMPSFALANDAPILIFKAVNPDAFHPSVRILKESCRTIRESLKKINIIVSTSKRISWAIKLNVEQIPSCFKLILRKLNTQILITNYATSFKESF